MIERKKGNTSLSCSALYDAKKMTAQLLYHYFVTSYFHNNDMHFNWPVLNLFLLSRVQSQQGSMKLGEN